MTLDNKIEAYAKSVGVSRHDAEMFLNSMMNSMKKDGLRLEQITTDLVEAYAKPVNDKMISFTSTYLTKPCARQAIQSAIAEQVN